MKYWIEATLTIGMMIVCVVLGFGLGVSHIECESVVLPYFNLHNFTVQDFNLTDYDAWKCYPEANFSNLNTCYVVTNSSNYTQMYQMFCQQDKSKCDIMREYVLK